MKPIGWLLPMNCRGTFYASYLTSWAYWTRVYFVATEETVGLSNSAANVFGSNFLIQRSGMSRNCCIDDWLWHCTRFRVVLSRLEGPGLFEHSLQIWYLVHEQSLSNQVRYKAWNRGISYAFFSASTLLKLQSLLDYSKSWRLWVVDVEWPEGDKQKSRL